MVARVDTHEIPAFWAHQPQRKELGDIAEQELARSKALVNCSSTKLTSVQTRFVLFFRRWVPILHISCLVPRISQMILGRSEFVQTLFTLFFGGCLLRPVKGGFWSRKTNTSDGLYETLCAAAFHCRAENGNPRSVFWNHVHCRGSDDSPGRVHRPDSVS